MRRIILIQPDGSTTTLPDTQKLTLEAMQKMVGGYIEHVRVLDHIKPDGERVYSSMFVNEEGLLNDMIRNPKATEIYQRNVRTAFPNHPNPFKAAEDMMRESYPHGTEVIDGTPAKALAQGYKTDPWIAGPAIYFEGWTVESVEEWMNHE